jgi:hypothetical protein
MAIRPDVWGGSIYGAAVADFPRENPPTMAERARQWGLTIAAP